MTDDTKRQAVTFDTELQRHHTVLLQAIGAQRYGRVLDIGCGSGQTTREAARAAGVGALGVDISEPAVELARRLTRAAGLRDVTFEQADAQVHPFPPERFDLAISRFGTMFFDEPVTAFANVARALQPAGRLVMAVWGAREHNEWSVAIRDALEAADVPAAGAPRGPDPFSLGDPPTVSRTLQAAGFADVTFTEVHEPVYYGQDVAAAWEWVRSFALTRDVLKGRGPAAATRAEQRLRDVFAAHLSDDGVWFDSRAWIVSARRR